MEINIKEIINNVRIEIVTVNELVKCTECDWLFSFASEGLYSLFSKNGKNRCLQVTKVDRSPQPGSEAPI